MRTALGLFLLLVLPGVVLALGLACADLFQATTIVVPFAIGTMCGLALEFYLLRRFYVIGVFEHELTHALVALLLLRRVHRFVVTNDRGGYVQHSGGFGGLLGDELIGLAPYILPTFTAIGILLRPIISVHDRFWIDLGIGVTFGYHLLSTLSETSQSWSNRSYFESASGEMLLSDIARRGRLYSLIFILTLTLGVHGLLCGILVHGYAGARAWWSVAFETSETVLMWLFDAAAKFVQWLQEVIRFLPH
jgi:hypothetical protein